MKSPISVLVIRGRKITRREAKLLLYLVLTLVGLTTTSCRTAGGTGANATDSSVSWQLRFKDNKSISDGVLSDVVVDHMADFEKSGFARSVLDDAAYSIESHYRSMGWPAAVAIDELEERGDGSLRATIIVSEGKRCELGRVSFDGVTAFRERDLRDLIGRPELGLFDSTIWFVRSELEAAVSAITSQYLAAGYLLVRVAPPAVSFRKDGRFADAVFSIEEGVLFQIAEIAFEGTTILTREELLAEIPAQIGEPYSPQADRRVQSALIEALGFLGYPNSEVRVRRRAHEETGEVALNVHIEAGQYVTVNDIRIEGNQRTKDSLVRSRLDVVLGEPFTPSRRRKTFRQLFTTGLFSSISLDLEADEDEAERTLVVSVIENPSREIFVEPGWGSYELARVKAGYRNKNLFGTGRGFRAEGIASLRHTEFELGVNDPFLFGSDVFADISATVLNRIEPSFTRITSGFDATLARQWRAGFETGLAYQFRRSSAEDVDITDADALAALDSVSISAIEVSVRHDTRDNPLVPRDGGVARFSLQWGDQVLGSQLDFLRARLQLTHFVPLRHRNILGLSFRTGGIVPTHDTVEIPLQERFFNGGEGTVRSFRENELGPLDATGEALGGEAFTVFSAELRHQIAGNLSGAFFIDAGNTAANYEDYLEFNEFRAAVGIGVRYMLPIGPLRVDGGWNPNPRDGEDSFVLHFSVGMPF